MSKQSERAAHWRAHVEQWRRSGQTQSAYCAEHGVSKKSLVKALPRICLSGC